MNACHSPLVTGRLASACGVSSAEKRGVSQSKAKPSPAWPIATAPSAPRTHLIAPAVSSGDAETPEKRATRLATAVSFHKPGPDGLVLKSVGGGKRGCGWGKN